MQNQLTKELAEAFLRWPLPESVCADLCATKQGPGRIGTSLLSYVEAEQMMREVVLPLLKKQPKPRLYYYQIYSPKIKEVIGHCTSDGLEHAAREDPGVQFLRISRRQFNKETA